jgi:hypothetical protein
MKKIEEIEINTIQFLGEQSGEIEDELKSLWIPVLASNDAVRQAYLAMVSYDLGITYQPALCICYAQKEDSSLINALSKPFQQRFRNDVALDIIFLKPEQISQIWSVCEPFYDLV